MKIISVRQHPEIAAQAIAYIQSKWASPESMPVYEDCITQSLRSDSPLPQWYLLYDGDDIIGCVGLITNDFISRMDLWPWACALFVEEQHRGKGYGARLLARAGEDAKRSGFPCMYLCTDLSGYYEHHGYQFVGFGHHPWGETSRIYTIELQGCDQSAPQAERECSTKTDTGLSLEK